MTRFVSYTALLAAVGLISTGCVITDYPYNEANKTHAMLNATTATSVSSGMDFVDQSQHVVEPRMLEFLDLVVDYQDSGSTGWPALLGTGLTAEQARIWSRWLGPLTINGNGIGVGFGGFPGCPGIQWFAYMDHTMHWNLPAGAIGPTSPAGMFVSTSFTENCGANVFGGITGEGRAGRGPASWYLNDHSIIPTAITRHAELAYDVAPGSQFFPNIIAEDPRPGGITIGVSWLTRFAEVQVQRAPTTRDAGLAEFLMGEESLTVNVLGVDITGRGELLESGDVLMTLESLSVDGATFVPSYPLQTTLTRDGHFQAEFDLSNPKRAAALRELGQFALTHFDLDSTYDLSKLTIPELNYHAPPVEIAFSRENIEGWVTRLGDISSGGRTR